MTPPSEIMEIVSSAVQHLETCVSWRDDAGRTWAGPMAQAEMPPEMAAEALLPFGNTLQRRVDDALRWCRDNAVPARIIVLKGRRSGCSLICAKAVDLECRVTQTKALVMADVFKRSDEIFSMQSQFAASDIFPWQFGAVTTARSIIYGNGSACIKETALDPNAGRGGGYRVLWFSEAAHFPTDGVRDAKRLMLATLNTVPKIAGSIVLVESTANGCAGWYYERWLRAKWPEYDDYWKQWDASQGTPDPEEIWLRVFAAWFEIPRNAMTVSEGEASDIMAALSKGEKAGVERYGWAAAQIKWRRFTVRNDFNGDEARFDQEYPSDPDSAFVMSGSPAFARDSMATLRQAAVRAAPAWKFGVLEAVGASAEDVLNGKLKDVPVMFRQTPEEEAWFAVLEEPRDERHYLGVADPSTGADVTDGEGDLDATALLMLRAGYAEQVNDKTVVHRPRLVARIRWEIMEWHPHERQTLYMTALMARFYGNPPVVVETNKGEWMVIGLKQAGINLYRQQIYTRVTDKTTEQLGFAQTTETRHAIITRLQSLVHGSEVERDGERVWEPGVEIECLHAIGEMEVFSRDRHGKFKAASGKHDDDVLALAMGLWLIDGASRYRTRKVARRRR